MEIDDKGGEISTKIRWEVGFGHGHGQRGSNIGELRIEKDQNYDGKLDLDMDMDMDIDMDKEGATLKN
jgi:hypothetical protein